MALYLTWTVDDQKRLLAAGESPVSTATTPAATVPRINYPVEKIDGAPAPSPRFRSFRLPSLDHSDFIASDAIDAILDRGDFMRLVIPEAAIRSIVATVVGLSGMEVSERLRPIKPVSGNFIVENDARGTFISPANSARYATYIRAAESISAKRLVEFYVRLYPLFQQAYVELGYQNGYFNDRLISVIDDLLRAPEIAAPVYVYRSNVHYEFVDPELGRATAGQKILMRVGIENELRLKAKLQSIRTMLTARGAGRSPAPNRWAP